MVCPFDHIHQEIDFNTSPQLLYEALLRRQPVHCLFWQTRGNRLGSWGIVFVLWWQHFRAERGILSESQDRSGPPRCDLA